MAHNDDYRQERLLPAEWHRQSAVQLTWPHEGTDWAPMLGEVTECYVAMAREISLRERLIVVCPDTGAVRSLLASRLPEGCMERVILCRCDTNDTWARDHGFITLLSPGGPRLLDFRFNGWGQKFASGLDNQICRRMAEQGVLGGEYECHLDFTLEGGSIESDGRGTLLTTEQCLMAPNRNEPLTRDGIERRLKEALGASRVLWLRHGALAGDDTDSHVDTLARLCPDDTIAYVRCDDPADPHHTELTLMEDELRLMRTADGRPYRLLPLPMAPTVLDGEGQRMPSTYANFLVVNGAVLMPTYGNLETDSAAAFQLAEAFPGREVVGIDCRPLVMQHGSLHCCTMQFPAEVEVRM